MFRSKASSSLVIGSPLASTLADAMGYNVAHDEWPAWIDQVAAAIVSTARKEGFPSDGDSSLRKNPDGYCFSGQPHC